MQWNAGDNLKDARKETSAVEDSLPDVDLFAWWCNHGGGRTAGKAYVGRLCDKKGWATSICEYQGNPAGAGYVSF